MTKYPMHRGTTTFTASTHSMHSLDENVTTKLLDIDHHVQYSGVSDQDGDLFNDRLSSDPDSGDIDTDGSRKQKEDRKSTTLAEKKGISPYTAEHDGNGQKTMSGTRGSRPSTENEDNEYKGFKDDGDCALDNDITEQRQTVERLKAANQSLLIENAMLKKP